MLQFEILVDMIEFKFAQDRPVSRKSFILLICYFVLIKGEVLLKKIIQSEYTVQKRLNVIFKDKIDLCEIVPFFNQLGIAIFFFSTYCLCHASGRTCSRVAAVK